MKKNLILYTLTLVICTLSFSCSSQKNLAKQDRTIRLKVPERPAGQQHMLEFRAEPIKTVRVAFIGLGMRGPGAVERMMNIPGVEIAALCDVKKENVEKVSKMLKEKGFPAAKEFYGDTIVWRQVTALPDVDLVYVVTDWQSHAKIGIQAMEDGKHVAIEVPAALTMDEIWGLINTSERTRKHCVQLENCVYDFFELTALNMAQQGVFGEIIHGEGAYIHGLQPFWDQYWSDWRMRFNRENRGDVYPTHGLGPVCQAMNIHRGDKMNFLVAVDTKPLQNPMWLKAKRGVDAPDFRNGDHTMTMIRTENGRSILVEHDIVSPRPYSRMYQLSGTKGFANKYPSQGFALSSGSIDPELAKNHENLITHRFVSNELRAALMEKYRHPIVDKELEALAKKVGGHGGMDFIMDYRLIYCLQKGLHMDMDVYDLAEWCCLIPLTEISLDNDSAPVEIPDFTRGYWNKLSKLNFAR